MTDNFDIPRPTPKEVTPLSPDDIQERLSRAGDLADTAFHARMGGGFARHTEEWFSGDAATAFVLASMEDGSEHLLPIGWGEFSKQTFEGDQYPAFRDVPYDIYVVRQSDSYFANDEQRKLMKDKPREYLKQNAWIAAKAGHATKAERRDNDSYDHELQYDIQPVPYDSLMAQTRNLVVNTDTVYATEEPMTPDVFNEFMGKVPRTVDGMRKFISEMRTHEYFTPRDLHGGSERTVTEADKVKQRDRTCIDLLMGMGIYRVGSLVGDEQAMQSIIDIASKWDSSAKAFKE